MYLSWTSRDRHKHRLLDEAMACIAQGEAMEGAIFECMVNMIDPPLLREKMPSVYLDLAQQRLAMREALADDDEHGIYLEALLIANKIDPHTIPIDVALHVEFVLERQGQLSYRALVHEHRVRELERKRGDGSMDSEQFLANCPEFLKDALSPELQAKAEQMKVANG